MASNEKGRLWVRLMKRHRVERDALIECEHEEAEEALLRAWVDALPLPYRDEMSALYAEMNARQTLEAKIYKAIDSLEAVIQHNLSDISTWIPHEYQLNQTYGFDKAAFSPYLTALREEIRKDTLKKIAAEDSQ